MLTSKLRFLVCALLVAAALVSCGKEKRDAGVESGAIQWLDSFDAALAAARDANKPVMIDFYTDWCGWCKRLDGETYVDRQVVSAAADFVCVKINADMDRATTSKYNITGFPTIIFVSPAGDEVHRVVGYRPPPPAAQNFLAEMNRALQAFKGRS